MQYLIRGLLAACLAGSVCVGASAETPEIPDPTIYAPEVHPTRISRDDAPKIDGVLDDPIWSEVETITEFYTVEPALQMPSQDTIVYMAYDEQALYVAIHAFDTEPDKIITRIMERDGEVWRDDMVRFYIDPFNTGLGGFGFDVNAIGARLDRLIQRGGPPTDEWDAIWNSAGQVTDDGWTAEIVIPFRAISFDPTNDEGWGLLITREIARNNEEIRWSSIDPGVSTFDFRNPGRLQGITNVEQGMGLDVELLGTVIASRDWTNPRDDDLTIEPSANIYYKLTPSLTGLLTLNSDFSDTPLDNRQINTGRFSLFQPETRDFFLQDASVFTFAGDTFGGNPNGRPFFSRRIGTVGGEQVDLKAGLKLSGEFKGVEMGVLSARMGGTDNIEAQTLSVARATVDVLDNSRLGFIATNGDPTGATENTLIGSDFIYRDNSFMGGGLLQATAFFMQTITSDMDDYSYGLGVSYPNDKWGWNLSYREIGEDYRPALGFVNRPGTGDWRAGWHRRYRPNGEWLQQWQYGTKHTYITDLDGNLQTRKNEFNLEIINQATDQLQLDVFEAKEVVSLPFSMPESIVVPAGEYSNNGVSGFLRSSFTRPYGTETRFTVQDYFGGERFKLDLQGSLRPSRFWNMKLQYERDDISVPAGDVVIQIYSLENVVNVNPSISIATQAQYDNISDGFSWFSRVRWEVRPETEVFLSFGHGAIINYEDFPRDFESVQTQFVLRFGNRFQF